MTGRILGFYKDNGKENGNYYKMIGLILQGKGEVLYVIVSCGIL